MGKRLGMHGQYYVCDSVMSTSLADSETDSKALLQHYHHHGRRRKGWKPYFRLKSKSFADVVLAETEESSTSAQAREATSLRRWPLFFCWRVQKDVPSVDSSLSSYPTIRATSFSPPLPLVEYESTEATVSHCSISTAISKATIPSQSKDTALLFSSDEKCWGHHVQLEEDWGPAVPRTIADFSPEKLPHALDRLLPSEPALAFSSPSSSDTSGLESPSDATEEELDSSVLFHNGPSSDISDLEILPTESSQAKNSGKHLIATNGLQPLFPFNASTRIDTPLIRAKVLNTHSRHQSESAISVAALKKFDYRPPAKSYQLPSRQVPRETVDPVLTRKAVDNRAHNYDVPLGATATNPVKETCFPSLLPGHASGWSNRQQYQESHVEQDAEEATLNHRFDRAPGHCDANPPDHKVYLEKSDSRSLRALTPRDKIRTSLVEKSGRDVPMARPEKSFSRFVSTGVSSTASRGSVDGLVSLDSQAVSHWDPDNIATTAATPVASNRYAQHLGFLQTLVKEAKLSNYTPGEHY